MDVSLTGLGEFVTAFVQRISKEKKNRARVVGLQGELGSGKTTFVQALAGELGVRELVMSPTYMIVHVYAIEHPLFKKLVHVDAYRLNSEEKDTIGWAEYSDNPQNLIFVEWPERLPGGMPQGAKSIRFTVTGVDTRDITEEHG